MPVLGRIKVSEKKCFAGTVMRPRWPLGRAFLESILQHDPKTVQMDLMNDGSGASSDPRESFLAPRGHYKIIVLDPSLPRHGRCWAKPIQSGCAVAEANLALLKGVRTDAADPLLRLAGHWWEQKRSKCAASLKSGFFVEDLLVFELSPVACGFHAISRHRWKKSSFAKWGRARSLRPPPATCRPLVGAKTLETCCESHIWILCQRFTCFWAPTSGLQVPRRRWRKSSLAKGGIQLGTADPLYRRDLRLAGHWWEPAGAHRGCARPRQTWCCTNGVGASQATGESFFKQILGMKVNSWTQHSPKITSGGSTDGPT